MTEFTRYRRTAIGEARPYEPGESVGDVSINPEDARAGSPKPGDMIFRNPKNHKDQSAGRGLAYFADNYEPIE